MKTLSEFKMYKQLVLAEYKNGEHILYLVQSNSPITIEKVAKYFEEYEDMDFERESITFMNEPEEIKI